MGDEYATKSDIDAIRRDLTAMHNGLHTKVQSVQIELGLVRDDLSAKIEAVAEAARTDTRAVGIMLERLGSKVDAFREVCSANVSKTEFEARISAVENLVRK